MTKNPFLNALVAALYIVAIASLMYYGPKTIGPINNVLVPIAMLSLFVLSAAMMGYFFVFQPIQLYLDGEKKQAVNLFIKTVIIFACITTLIFFTLFSRIFF